MTNTIVLSADEGKVITNGAITGKIIYLPLDYYGDLNDFYEITDAEYEAISNALQVERDKALAEKG